MANSVIRSSERTRSNSTPSDRALASRTWVDWLTLALGIAIVLAPWVTLETGDRSVVINAAVAGVAVMLLAELDLQSVRRWTEAGQVMLGLWVAASPIALGYGGGGALRFWHFFAGMLVAALGAVALWQAVSEQRRPPREG